MMLTIESLAAACVTAVAGYMGFTERRLAKMQSKIDEKVSQEDVEHLIDLKQGVTDVRLKELKEDLKEMKQDLKEIKNKL